MCDFDGGLEIAAATAENRAIFGALNLPLAQKVHTPLVLGTG